MIETPTRPIENPTWTPGVIIYANYEEQVIKVQVPGVKAEDVRVCKEPGALVVSGNSPFGPFLRRIDLRYDAPLDQVKTSLRLGVLEIHVPNPNGAVR